MIPILYESDERRFITNGIGRLSDCLSCTVTEERNGIYECEFTYPITGDRYEDIQEGRIIAVTHDNSGTIEPFDIYGRSAPINGIVTFYAHHVSYRLADIVVSPFSAASLSDALADLQINAINSNPFTFWTDKPGNAPYEVITPEVIRALLGGQEGSLLDVYGSGEYEFNRFDVKLWADRGTDSGVEIRYGKNLVDITHTIDKSESYNAVVPYWVNTETDEVVMLPEQILIYSGTLIQQTTLTDESLVIIRNENDEPINVGYQIIDAIPLDLSDAFEEAPTEAELRTAAQNRLANGQGWLPQETITVDFVQLWQTEEYKNVAPLQRVNLCDTVSVHYPQLGVNAVKEKVIKTVYNVLADRYDEIELGDPTTTLAEAVTGEITDRLDKMPTNSSMAAAINKTADLIRGGLGGYVVMNANANGEPQEILIMDEPDINQAVNVIRMNKNGIAFSQTGYNGPFISAWTIDGSFVADWITAGTMSADRIRGGTFLVGGGGNGNGLIILYDQNDVEVGWISNEGVSLTTTGMAGGSGTPEETYTHTLALIDSAQMQMSRNGTIAGRMGLAEAYSTNDSSWHPMVRIDGTYTVDIDTYASGANNGYSFLCNHTGAQNEKHSFGSKVYVYGAFGCSGTKSRTVDTDNYGNRALYSYETPTPLFGDIGEAVIDEDGLAYVDIDDIFTETIAQRVEYQVFLQKEGPGDCWIAEKQPNYFVISGTPGLRVAWEIKAKQRDYEYLRLETNANLDEYADQTDELLEE